ncbi:MAG: hypothetical protein J07HN6_01711 [Halonotius sp. J07HN6]|jgi:hypothetical protein|nr:MAG: hypothetical protein J07HN6_01711 [Halonotius sp. J07HN6]
MRITRRNTLAVLLVIVAAGGIVGTGAFSQVSADRDLTVQTAGDGSANVQIDVNEEVGVNELGSDSTTVGLEFVDLNRNATTTFNETLAITPGDQGDSGSYDVSISGVSGISGFSAQGPSSELSAGETGYVNFTIDSSAATDGTLDVTDGTITIVVEDTTQ